MIKFKKVNNKRQFQKIKLFWKLWNLELPIKERTKFFIYNRSWNLIYWNKQLIGSFNWYPTKFNNLKYLIAFYIKPEYRNNGLGSLVLQKIIKENKKKTFIHLTCEEPLEKFYLKNNFRSVEKINGEISMITNGSKA